MGSEMCIRDSPSTLWLVLINTDPAKICNNRARVSSYSMGYTKMQLLSTWTPVFSNMDGSQTVRRNFSQITPRARQSKIDENEGKNSSLLIYSHVGTRKSTLHCRRSIKISSLPTRSRSHSNRRRNSLSMYNSC